MIDLTTHTVLQEIPVGLLPQNILISPDGQYLLTTNLQDNSVSWLGLDINS